MKTIITTPEPPVFVQEETPARDPRAIFAIASLILGVLDLPAMTCGVFLAMAGGMGEAASPGDQTAGTTGIIMMIVAAAVPLLICLTGIVTGILGLHSKRRVMAIFGIVLSGLFLLMPCIFLVLPIIFGSSLTFG